MALTLAKNCTKLGLSGGAVYWSVQQGVWGTPEEGHDAMKRLTEAIVPSQEPIKKVVTPLIQEGGIVSGAWNKGTKVVFESLIEAPQLMGNYASQAGSAVSRFVTDNISDSNK